MTTATIENDPISIQLDNSSTTVPANEVWKVTIVSIGLSEGGGNSDKRFESTLKINDIPVASSETEYNRQSVGITGHDSTTFPFETVVIDGDVLEHEGEGGIHIGGFVVNDNYTP